MMVKKIVFGILFLFVVQATAGGLGFGPQVGYYKSKDADQGKVMYGGAVRLKLAPALGVEGSINYRQEKYNNGDLIVKSWPVFVTGLIYPLPIIYGAAGAGWYYTTFDYPNQPSIPLENRTVKKFGWHFGGGIELPLGSNSKIAGDIRYVFLDYDFKEIPGSKDLKNDFFMIEATLLFGL